MIVITGANGGLGNGVVRGLLARGVPAGELVAAVRTPAKAADLAALGVTVREADYDRPETLGPAFADARRLLLVSSVGTEETRVRQHLAAVEAARVAGVELLAYTSVVNADTNPLALAEAHRATERAIAASGLPSVLLRNGWYNENHLTRLSTAVATGELPGSAGEGRIAFAARADYAEAAAEVLTLDDQAGRVHELTGPTAWSLAELAAEAARITGRPVAYRDLPGERFAEALRGAGLPEFVVELLVDVDLRVAGGVLETVTDELPKLLGRPATPPSATLAEALRA
ncbi:NAD(P)H dehydrogenase (quinone) [Streptomyces zhaozhouensis]|uniref:NAD(P)H dehydrogenase (Quinone) n=1 Tax=Streptomyces zhaozhouensis TaxID=1300267 RepID=A0A286DJS9_9ACTN|nr:NAD(P)H-binding protein [Streptomyces zhaozhouensis]SOD59017.1 NAD(P)H dehydrogenase (quinone) [Streptomyces zhaozhouensis]